MENTVQNAESLPREEGKQAARREFVELIKIAITFLIVFWLVKSFVVEGYEVLGESMTPTLDDGDRILVFKLPQELSKLPLLNRLKPFKEKDIIVFEGEGRKRLVKRIITFNPPVVGNKVDAQSEEDSHLIKVEFDRGAVRVNNWQIDESAYLPKEARKTRDKSSCMLHPGEFYVLGDHRQVSKDSRSFSAISDEQILGRAVLRFWPLSKFKLL